MKYEVIKNNDILNFQGQISRKLNEGWTCVGGVSVLHWSGSIIYYQAMSLQVPPSRPSDADTFNMNA